MDEQWVPIHGYEQYYEVSNLGRIRNIPRVIHMACRGGCYTSVSMVNHPTLNGKGYGRVFLSLHQVVKTKYVHRIVAEHWCINPLGRREVNHIDGNKTNNAANNLEWVSHRENCVHARKTGLFVPSPSKFTTRQVDEIIFRCNNGESPICVAKTLGVNKTSIYHILAGTTWAWHTHINRKGVVD